MTDSRNDTFENQIHNIPAGRLRNFMEEYLETFREQMHEAMEFDESTRLAELTELQNNLNKFLPLLIWFNQKSFDKSLDRDWRMVCKEIYSGASKAISDDKGILKTQNIKGLQEITSLLQDFQTVINKDPDSEKAVERIKAFENSKGREYWRKVMKASAAIFLSSFALLMIAGAVPMLIAATPLAATAIEVLAVSNTVRILLSTFILGTTIDRYNQEYKSIQKNPFSKVHSLFAQKIEPKNDKLMPSTKAQAKKGKGNK